MTPVHSRMRQTYISNMQSETMTFQIMPRCLTASNDCCPKITTSFSSKDRLVNGPLHCLNVDRSRWWNRQNDNDNWANTVLTSKHHFPRSQFLSTSVSTLSTACSSFHSNVKDQFTLHPTWLHLVWRPQFQCCTAPTIWISLTSAYECVPALTPSTINSSK